MTPLAALALCRIVHDASTMLVWGAFAYLAILVPRTAAAHAGARLSAVLAAATVLAVASTAAALPIEVAAVGDGWADAIDPVTVRAVLFETAVGRAWQVQAVAAALLAAARAVPVRARPGATAAAAGLSLATLALTGHAVMDEGWPGRAHQLNHAVHVLAAGAWLGALLPLLPLLRALDDPALHREAGTALRRFSVAGHGAVALVVATGSVNTWLILGRWPTDWSSPYQALLSAKLAFVAAMVGLAVANRYVNVPRLRLDPARTVRSLRLVTIAVVGLGLAVIGCVGVFGLLEPA